MIYFKIFIILAVFTLGLAIIWAWFFDDWNCYFRNTKIRLDFDHFVSLYSIAPKNYDISNHRIRYTDPKKYESYSIGFSYRDYRKFKRWCKQTKKKEEEFKTIRAKRDFLESINRDIDSYKASSKEELEALNAKVANGESPQSNNDTMDYRVGGGGGASGIIYKRSQNGGLR